MMGHASQLSLGEELKGITVVSLEQAVAAPYCGLLLADAGARVIKVEREGGDFARSYDGVVDGLSAYFVWLNRGKESIVLDLNSENDVVLLRSMLARADVLLHNLAPGTLERRGLSGPGLRTVNPRLVTCEITGYGRDGPYAGMKAYDLLVQAESGLCSVTGTEDAPARVGISLCDLATGLTAFSAIMRALLLRSRTGLGIDVSISMFDVMADWMNVPLLYHRYGGGAPRRIGVAHPTLAPYGLYRTKDGGELLIAIQSNREWLVFCSDVLDMPGLASDERFSTNERRVSHRAELDGYIDRCFARYGRGELMSLLQRHRIACAGLNSVPDLDVHTQLRNDVVEFGGKQFRLADLPVRNSRKRSSHVPVLDENGAQLRVEFSKAPRLRQKPIERQTR